jgi:hypothetical protein
MLGSPDRPLHYVALDKLVPILVNTPLMLFETAVIAAVAPRAMIAATRAYSIRSCPDSSLIRADRIGLSLIPSLRLFIIVLLLISKNYSMKMVNVGNRDVNHILSLAQRE